MSLDFRSSPESSLNSGESSYLRIRHGIRERIAFLVPTGIQTERSFKNYPSRSNKRRKKRATKNGTSPETNPANSSTLAQYFVCFKRLGLLAVANFSIEMG